MTYPPGGPGYSSPPQAQYSAPTQQFDRVAEPAPAGPSKLPVYLGAAVTVLGFAIYLTSFGPLFGGASLPATMLVIAPLLAGLLAGASLLPKQDDRSTVAAVLAVLGFLVVVLVVLGDGPSIGWAFYPFIVFSVLQAIAAVGKLLLDAGVITAPAPRPKYEQPQPYGQYGAPPPSYYGQQPQQGYGPPQQGYQPQYGGGGYPGQPNTGGFPALGRPGGPQGAPQNGTQNGPQHETHNQTHNQTHNGPPTPPTGFPAFGQPQAQSAGAGSGQQNDAFDSQQTQVAPQQAPQQSAPPPS